MRQLYKFGLFFLIGFLVFSCRKNLESPKWDTQILTPIISTNLKIENLVDSSEFLSVNSENVISIVHQDELYKLENPLDSLVGLSIAPFNSIFTLETLELEDVSISQSIVLDSFKFLENVPVLDTFTIPDGTPFNEEALANFGRLPELDNEVDISDLLVEAVLSQALFSIRIENSTEFDLVGLKYKISNVSGDSLISDSVALVSPGEVYTKELDLAVEMGETPVTGNLSISISGAEIAVPEDQETSNFNYVDFISLEASITDIKVKSALAQFAAQEVINSQAPVDVMPGGSEKLQFARIEDGIVNLKAFSTLATDLSIEYAIENLTRDGEEFVLRDTIKNDFSTSVNQKDIDFSFNDYEFDFTLEDPFREYNSFRRRALGNISATMGVQRLSLDDTLGVDVSVKEISPSYVRG